MSNRPVLDAIQAGTRHETATTRPEPVRLEGEALTDLGMLIHDALSYSLAAFGDAYTDGMPDKHVELLHCTVDALRRASEIFNEAEYGPMAQPWPIADCAANMLEAMQTGGGK